jgi:hypothetical protein
MEGLEWFFDRKVVTIWSTPNYMYRSGNVASVMKYEKEGISHLTSRLQHGHVENGKN